LSETELLHALLRLAIEHMTDAIRRISHRRRLRSGGSRAAGLWWCRSAARLRRRRELGMKRSSFPSMRASLSAVGLQEAVPEVIEETGDSHAADSGVAFDDKVVRAPCGSAATFLA
jgi:5-oxoprolinase (ATP-hydrolysing)